MASDAFVVWNSETLVAPAEGLAPGIPTPIGSVTFENKPTPRPNIVITVTYEAVIPDITAGLPPFAITCVLEIADANGNWTPVAYQFSEWRNTQQTPKRIIRMQPDISDFNTGIDDSVWAGSEIARISRQQGRLTDADFRVCIIVTDNDPTGPNAFQSVTLSASGDRYD